MPMQPNMIAQWQEYLIKKKKLQKVPQINNYRQYLNMTDLQLQQVWNTVSGDQYQKLMHNIP